MERKEPDLFAVGIGAVLVLGTLYGGCKAKKYWDEEVFHQKTEAVDVSIESFVLENVATEKYTCDTTGDGIDTPIVAGTTTFCVKTWSDRGQAFSSSNAAFVSSENHAESDNTVIYILNKEGTMQQIPSSMTGAYSVIRDISEDGTTLLYTRDRSVHIADLEEGTIEIFTSKSGIEEFALSADKHYVGMRTESYKDQRLATFSVFDREKNSLSTLAEQGYVGGNISFSQDGNYLLFYSVEDNPDQKRMWNPLKMGDLYKMDIKTGDAERVTRCEEGLYLNNWVDTGDHLFYYCTEETDWGKNPEIIGETHKYYMGSGMTTILNEGTVQYPIDDISFHEYRGDTLWGPFLEDSVGVCTLEINVTIRQKIMNTNDDEK
jgi:hypothetical protein